jgi:hypothetical protein
MENDQLNLFPPFAPSPTRPLAPSPLCLLKFPSDSHYPPNNKRGLVMLLYRVYIALLALVFLLLTLVLREVGLVEGTLVTCALLFLIFDTRLDLLRRREIEKQIDSLLDGI